MFTTRLISGIVLVILAIFFVGKGGALLFAVTALISLEACLNCTAFWIEKDQ
ncbi:MAG: hypothetical protein ACLT4E_00630 [Clostridium sp.]